MKINELSFWQTAKEFGKVQPAACGIQETAGIQFSAFDPQDETLNIYPCRP
jgi:hypothetical protein